LTLPVFLILVFGVIEFSYAFAQNNEIRHVAREAAREASVEPSADTIALVCDNLALIRPGDVLNISVTPNSATAGDSATIEVSANYSTLTGFFDGMFAGVTLETSHQFYVEQPTTGSSSWPAPDVCP
jgi:Flp pilus assembly protein TadG